MILADIFLLLWPCAYFYRRLLALIKMATNNTAQGLPTQMVELPDANTLFERLRCTMCKRYPIFSTDVIYSCPDGHISCGPCSKVQQKRGCTKAIAVNGVCKKPVTSRTSVPVVEYMYNFSKFKCSNRGCKEEILGLEMKEHLKHCNYNRMKLPCPDASCSRVVEYNREELWNHIQTDHSNVLASSQELYVMLNFYDESNANFHRPESKERLQMVFNAVEAFGEKFVIICTESPSSSFFFGCVLNNEAVAEKFYVMFEAAKKLNEKNWPAFKVLAFDKLKGLRNMTELLKMCQDKKALMICKDDLLDNATEDAAIDEKGENGEEEIQTRLKVGVRSCKVRIGIKEKWKS